MFSFINKIHDDFSGGWHTNATDHTGDEGGYMFLVNAAHKPGEFYNGRVNGLCVGVQYQFSVYLANVCKHGSITKPNIRFEVRSADEEKSLLVMEETGQVATHDRLTWNEYDFSFTATTNSVKLLMISKIQGGVGNDFVIDDIALRVCAGQNIGICF